MKILAVLVVALIGLWAYATFVMANLDKPWKITNVRRWK